MCLFACIPSNSLLFGNKLHLTFTYAMDVCAVYLKPKPVSLVYTHVLLCMVAFTVELQRPRESNESAFAGGMGLSSPTPAAFRWSKLHVALKLVIHSLTVCLEFISSSMHTLAHEDYFSEAFRKR